MLEHLILPMALSVALTDARRRQMAQMLRASWQSAHMQMKDAAFEADRDQGQFTREIDAEQGSLRVLYQQPDLWWQRLAISIVATFGLPEEIEHGRRLKRMAKMDAVQKEKRTA